MSSNVDIGELPLAPSAPRVAGALLAANAAFDMQQRVSAHALFSQVTVDELPWEFPAPFYVVLQVEGVGSGVHILTVVGEGALEMSAQPTEFSVMDDTAIIVHTVQTCTVQAPGYLSFYVELDGKRIDSTFHLVVKIEGSDESVIPT